MKNIIKEELLRKIKELEARVIFADGWSAWVDGISPLVGEIDLLVDREITGE